MCSILHIFFFLFGRYLYPFELHEKETLKPSVKEEVIERNSRDKNIKPESPESPPDSSDEKHLECLEPSLDIDEDHEEVIVKKQSTRIKEMKRQQSRDLENSMLSESQTKSPEEDVSVDVVNSPESSSDVSEPQSDSKSDIPVDENTFEVGDKIQVKYGRGRNHRLYDAKVRYSTVKFYHQFLKWLKNFGHDTNVRKIFRPSCSLVVCGENLARVCQLTFQWYCM